MSVCVCHFKLLTKCSKQRVQRSSANTTTANQVHLSLQHRGNKAKTHPWQSDSSTKTNYNKNNTTATSFVLSRLCICLRQRYNFAFEQGSVLGRTSGEHVSRRRELRTRGNVSVHVLLKEVVKVVPK